ncbi:hypothetical protein LUZ61_002989 [Rhynchospora tenuis]|uniref:Myb/SANT-like domain-containing protein n=1 Tax=Rhynchospora tenuis TaxID=198213 RepID=A0AAD5ZKD7_9POAL|nr:hypothetical protein LUZ61_002989 [Rhynchospora tenuis]
MLYLAQLLLDVDPDNEILADVDRELANARISNPELPAHDPNEDENESKLGEMIRDRIANEILFMGKRKNPQVELVTWTQNMDDVLLDALEYQSIAGNRVSGTFTSKAYDNILKELCGKFGDVPFDKEKIKNRVKYLKKNFAKRPEAGVWMTKPVRNYKKLEALFGDDRAVEEDADTAAELRERNARLNDAESEIHVGETVEEIDFMVSQNQATIGGYNVDPESLLNKSSGGKKEKKQKTRRSVDAETINLNESF